MTASAAGPVPPPQNPERTNHPLDPARRSQHIIHAHPGHFSMKIPGHFSVQLNNHVPDRDSARPSTPACTRSPSPPAPSFINLSTAGFIFVSPSCLSFFFLFFFFLFFSFFF